MTKTPQNLTASQLDARIIEARHWLNSDSPCAWDQEWCPEATAALHCSRDAAAGEHAAAARTWQARADYDGNGLTGDEYRKQAEARRAASDKKDADLRAAIARNDIFDRGYQADGNAGETK